jgi:hypothetical protein
LNLPRKEALGGVLLHDVQDHVAQDCEILRGIAQAVAILILDQGAQFAPWHHSVHLGQERRTPRQRSTRAEPHDRSG